jgi:hypothetical protein
LQALIIALALAGLSTAAAAQDAPASVMGTVSDTVGRPLPAAQVWVVGTQMTTRTDSLGHYRFDSLVAGPARLRTMILGYFSTQQSTVLTAGQRTTLDFRVASTPVSDGSSVVRSVPLEKGDSQ